MKHFTFCHVVSDNWLHVSEALLGTHVNDAVSLCAAPVKEWKYAYPPGSTICMFCLVAARQLATRERAATLR